ncbi:hypothetical protein OPV22_015281 [Ensete ventricosum]|uniref:Uncharacterized protein n=1 Tax=Ensete ventricosum TaxID=4639 RepID=A0AAV8R3H3_ENSVE|nr:hypothetical protein OPV22_015281 [Ensete ventricosum]
MRFQKVAADCWHLMNAEAWILLHLQISVEHELASLKATKATVLGCPIQRKHHQFCFLDKREGFRGASNKTDSTGDVFHSSFAPPSSLTAYMTWEGGGGGAWRALEVEKKKGGGRMTGIKSREKCNDEDALSLCLTGLLTLERGNLSLKSLANQKSHYLAASLSLEPLSRSKAMSDCL